MAAKEKLVAVFAPSIRSIKLYADGRIDYQGKSGSVIGATARVEKSGERHRFRDTREVVLRIDGPRVAIVAPLPPAGFQVHRQAEKFVAQINEMSNQIDGSGSARGGRPSPHPSEPIDRSVQPDTPVPDADSAASAVLLSMDALIGQLERLGKLRDSGVLTEDEFQEQKKALLRATHKF